jgi:hypothetical protein
MEAFFREGKIAPHFNRLHHTCKKIRSRPLPERSANGVRQGLEMDAEVLQERQRIANSQASTVRVFSLESAPK